MDYELVDGNYSLKLVLLYLYKRYFLYLVPIVCVIGVLFGIILGVFLPTTKSGSKFLGFLGVNMQCQMANYNDNGTAVNLQISQDLQESGQSPQEGSDNPSGSASGRLFVDIGGAVNNPGVYELQSGAMLKDVMIAAGGFSEESNYGWLSKNLNLSEKLVNHAKVYIPFEFESMPEPHCIVNGQALADGAKLMEPSVAGVVDPASIQSVQSAKQSGSSAFANSSGSGSSSEGSSGASAADGSSSLINVNTSPQDALESLPGIGEVYARKIIDNRPYLDLEDFKTKTSFSANLMSKIQDSISF